MNEHALRVGRWVVRFPHRHSQSVVTGWCLSMPRLLTGWLPTTAEAQRGKRLINQGRIDQVRAGLVEIDREIQSLSNHD